MRLSCDRNESIIKMTESAKNMHDFSFLFSLVSLLVRFESICFESEMTNNELFGLRMTQKGQMLQ